MAVPSGPRKENFSAARLQAAPEEVPRRKTALSRPRQYAPRKKSGLAATRKHVHRKKTALRRPGGASAEKNSPLPFNSKPKTRLAARWQCPVISHPSRKPLPDAAARRPAEIGNKVSPYKATLGWLLI